MLRLIVLLLVLANAGYYAWSHGLLAAYGFAPVAQSEPQRVAQQIKPEALRVLTSQDAARQLDGAVTPPAQTATAQATAAECLQVGLFNEEQTVVLRDRLTVAMPTGSWALESVLEPARWLVYMGKYNSAEAVTKKQGELRGLGVSFEALTNATLQPGLSLGSFKTQAEAETELTRIAKKGVKTAKVVQERAELRGQRLRLSAVDAALRSQLDNIKPQLAGKPFLSC
jgi:hypothetical protein